ncbi:hypothetical protein WKW50_25335 [Ochrobactrum sp. GPK 3]
MFKTYHTTPRAVIFYSITIASFQSVAFSATNEKIDNNITCINSDCISSSPENYTLYDQRSKIICPEDSAIGSDGEYNCAFDRFIGDDFSDLIGIVAYGIYKNAKREWASAFKREKKRAPTPQELRAYHASWTPTQIENARKSAEQLLSQHAKTVVEKEETRILRKALKGNFWMSVWQSILANSLYTIILIALTFIVSRAGVDLLGIFTRARERSEPESK